MSDELLEQALNFIRDNAKAYAKAWAEREYLKEFRKSKKAILMQEAERKGATTAAAQEREAYAHIEYQQLLDGLKIATEEAEKFKYLLKAAELKIDVWRSKEASRRKEQERYGA